MLYSNLAKNDEILGEDKFCGMVRHGWTALLGLQFLIVVLHRFTHSSKINILRPRRNAQVFANYECVLRKGVLTEWPAGAILTPDSFLLRL